MLDFLVIGAQKSGTTWLFGTLRQHPRISFPGGKEVHFWDIHRSRGLEWYSGLFARDDGRLHGDATPAYAVIPPGQIEECHRAFPRLRLIFTLRDPIERAWSAARMYAVREGMNVAEVPDDWFIANFLSEGSLARGDYERSLRNWLQFFPAEQLLLLRFEEIATAPEAYVDKCLKHLGLEPFQVPETTGLSSAAEVDPIGLRRKAREGIPLPLRPALRTALEEIYRDRIRSLAGFLGQDLSDWAACPPTRE